jgi:hypothetical protein
VVRRKNCRELVPTADISLPVSLMNLFWSLIDELHGAATAAEQVCPASCCACCPHLQPVEYQPSDCSHELC